MTGTRDGRTLRFERSFRHRVEKVFHVLTDEAESTYWFPARIVGERRAGAALRFVFGEKPPGVLADDLARLIHERQSALAGAPDDVFTGRVLAFEPPHLFAFSWGTDVARFELAPAGDATRLVFTYVLGDASTDERDVGPGWHVSLDWLGHRLDRTEPRTSRAELEALEREYRTRWA